MNCPFCYNELEYCEYNGTSHTYACYNHYHMKVSINYLDLKITPNYQMINVNFELYLTNGIHYLVSYSFQKEEMLIERLYRYLISPIYAPEKIIFSCPDPNLTPDNVKNYLTRILNLKSFL